MRIADLLVQLLRGVSGELEDKNWRLCSKTLVCGVPGELEDENWGLGSTTLVGGVSGELEDENWRLCSNERPKRVPRKSFPQE